MSYRLQMKYSGQWYDLHPISGEPLEFATEEDAYLAVAQDYPLESMGQTIRVVPADTPPTTPNKKKVDAIKLERVVEQLTIDVLGLQEQLQQMADHLEHDAQRLKKLEEILMVNELKLKGSSE